MLSSTCDVLDARASDECTFCTYRIDVAKFSDEENIFLVVNVAITHEFLVRFVYLQMRERNLLKTICLSILKFTVNFGSQSPRPKNETFKKGEKT